MLHGPDLRLAFLVDAESVDETEGTMFVDVLEVQNGGRVFVRLRPQPFASVSSLWLPASMIKGLPGSASTVATIRAVYGNPYDTWRLERADGTHLCDVRLMRDGSLSHVRYYALCEHTVVGEGVHHFDLGSEERVRDVIRAMITTIAQEMVPNAPVTVEWPPQRGVAPAHAAGTVRREP